ncbi:uncharacterized protein J7T54_001609 [Emericellopsis cladophorae]|uniref:Centromere protein H C-terminal domain-containing protein n=1 Tax=Emericellopsis cladophorae TaxID=2686198 RepID=A0A9P9Y530_9HYPO|nr:uncharacterized protein J7T54_001609 [Emericellopsis cladophorae]KAI6783733.1 hypothetical protein J7T54_001609 [Emericellopsis cladophorae]
MDASQDQPMQEAPEEVSSTLPVSVDEQRALDLYDKLQELRLEIAIINAQKSLQGSVDEGVSTEEAAATARNELSDTRARYVLRNQIVDSVLSTNPILKAVHNGTEASPVERDLLPYVQQRDEVAIAVASLATFRGKTREETTALQTEELRASKQNVALAAQVLQLAANLEQKRSAYLEDDGAQQAIRELGNGLKESRQRWRMIKGVTAGVVAGSGVDWARDEALGELVLDPEDNM